MKTRATQSRERMQLCNTSQRTGSEFVGLAEDVEHIEKKLNELHDDATHDDYRSVQSQIEQLRERVRSKTHDLLQRSSTVSRQLNEFELNAEEAAKAAMRDAERIDRLREEINNDFDERLKALYAVKRDGATYQEDEFQKIRTADEGLMHIVKRSQQLIRGALRRRWGAK